jgi:hypothetical protein
MDEIRDYFLPKLEAYSAVANYTFEQTQDMNQILADLKEHIDWRYKRPEGMYSKVKKMVEAWGVDDMTKRVKSVLRQTREQYVALHMAAKKKVIERNGKQTLIPYAHVMEVLNRLNDDDSIHSRVTLLMLCSGCRKIEILDPTIEFSQVLSRMTGQIDPQLIEQRGCAKKRASEKKALVKIVKPILFLSSDEFMSALEEVRGALSERNKKDRVTLGKTIATSMEKLAHELWPMSKDAGHRTGSHLSRAIYVNMAYQAHARGDESLNHFVARTLGHDELSTAAHYMNVRITEPSVEDVNKQK